MKNEINIISITNIPKETKKEGRPIEIILSPEEFSTMLDMVML